MFIIIILHLCLLIKVTSEYGGSWSQTSAPSGGPWISISLSSTGSYIVAAQGGESTSGDIYVSSTG